MIGENCGRDFDLVYERTFSALIRILLPMAGSVEAAEDLCQEAFVKLHQRMFSGAGFPGVDDARFWLIRVAKNLALNYAKRKTREFAAYKKALRDELLRPRHTQSGEEAYLKKELSHQIGEMLLLMPEKLREVLVLKEYGGLSYKEIAAVLKISEGNIKVRVFRAREWLAASFKSSEAMDVS